MAASLTTRLDEARAPFVLAIDVGSTGTRAGIFDAHARPVKGHRTKVGHAFTTIANGTSTIDPDQVTAEVRQVISAVVEGFPHPIDGVAIDTFASSLVGVDAAGAAITPCYTYADSRSSAQVNYLKSILNEDDTQQRTGTRQHTGYLPSRFLWLKQTDPRTFERVRQWMSLGEYAWLRIIGTTAAGTSTAAWTGMLNRRDPDAEKVSVLSYYLGDEDIRRKAWRIRATSPALTAQPNPAHRALVDLERAGRLAGIVTQNTDGLHLVAGSDPAIVHEIHGNARQWRCEDCGETGPLSDMVERINAGDDDPRCPACDGITRATVILFEEMLDPAVLDASVKLAETADLVLAIGTSLTVHPVAGLVPYAFGHSAKVVIVNAQETPYDYLADAILRDPIEEVVPRLVAQGLGVERPGLGFPAPRA